MAPGAPGTRLTDWANDGLFGAKLKLEEAGNHSFHFTAISSKDSRIDLVKEKIKSDDGCATSYTVVIAPPDVDRTFLHCPGANDAFSEQDITEEDLSGIDLLHFGYPPLMRRMFQQEGEELLRILKKAKEKTGKGAADRG